MKAPYTFEIEITLSNQQGHDETIFLGGIDAVQEEDLIESGVQLPLSRATSMLEERADDGDLWEIGVRCLSVVENATCENDWNNDRLPQRHDVTRLLEAMASQDRVA